MRVRVALPGVALWASLILVLCAMVPQSVACTFGTPAALSPVTANEYSGP